MTLRPANTSPEANTVSSNETEVHHTLVCPMCKSGDITIKIHEVCIARDWWVKDGVFQCEESRYTGEFVTYVPTCEQPNCGYSGTYGNSEEMLREWMVSNE